MNKLELVFTTPQGEVLYFEFDWQSDCSVADLLAKAQVYTLYPSLASRPVGIYGRVVDSNTLLQPGDRVEIYAPLRIDPKAARRLRAKKKGSV